VNGNKNVTFNLPESLLHEIKNNAAKRNQSKSSLVTDAVEKMVQQRDDEYEKAKGRILERLDHPFNLGTNDKITWTRDEVHERGVH
jgi:metal-responsive CopG/Arc/MetJ family transcriptional regulator